MGRRTKRDFLAFVFLWVGGSNVIQFFSEWLRFWYHMHQNSMGFHLIPHMTYLYEIQWRSICHSIPLKVFVVCRVFLSPSFLFLLFAKPALFHILWNAPIPNLMASRGVKIEFFWKKIWIQHELNYIQEPRTISYAFHLLNMILFWRVI